MECFHPSQSIRITFFWILATMCWMSILHYHTSYIRLLMVDGMIGFSWIKLKRGLRHTSKLVENLASKRYFRIWFGIRMILQYLALAVASGFGCLYGPKESFGVYLYLYLLVSNIYFVFIWCMLEYFEGVYFLGGFVSG